MLILWKMWFWKSNSNYLDVTYAKTIFDKFYLLIYFLRFATVTLSFYRTFFKVYILLFFLSSLSLCGGHKKVPQTLSPHSREGKLSFFSL